MLRRPFFSRIVVMVAVVTPDSVATIPASSGTLATGDEVALMGVPERVVVSPAHHAAD
jgi:hypothetical protein